MRQRAKRSSAIWMGPPDHAVYLNFYCHHCDAENIAEPVVTWINYADRLAAAECLACRRGVQLRIVGRLWRPYDGGPCVVWQIDGPEVPDDPQGGE